MAEETKKPEAKRGNRKERVGEVVSNKMTKTIVVRVERRFPHPNTRRSSPPTRNFTRTTKRRGQGRRHGAHRGNAAAVEVETLAARGSRRARRAGNTGGGLN
jgi:hypothetical protein